MKIKNWGEFALPFLKIIAILSLFTSCNKPSNERPLSALESQGKGVFMSNCIACHNPDPTQNGSVGPAISGSSLELIHERVVKAAYPANYKPKRESKMMPAFPQLEGDVPALHAYLNSFKK